MGRNGSYSRRRKRSRPNDLENQLSSDDHLANDNGELRAEGNSEDELQGSKNEVEVEEQLGLEPEMNPQIDTVMENDDEEDDGFPPYTPTQSPQHSLDSMISDTGSSSNVPMAIHRASDLLMKVSVNAETNQAKITNLANEAMEELITMIHVGEPLWQHEEGSENEVLNEVEYIKKFGVVDSMIMDIIRMAELGDIQCLSNLSHAIDFTNGGECMPASSEEVGLELLHTEASRTTAFVNINAINLVELLFDLKQWSSAFSSIVSRAMELGVLFEGVKGNRHGALKVVLSFILKEIDSMPNQMTAEFHLPSPLVPARGNHFARFSKQLETGIWGVVDVSLESLFPYPLVTFRRKPSGCLIQEMPNGGSKVAWVEHVEVDTRVHRLFQPLVTSGFAFGAKRWIATLIRHCRWQETLMSTKSYTIDDEKLSQCGRESLLKLAERMSNTFCVDISASTGNPWMPIAVNGAEDIRVMVKNSVILPGFAPRMTLSFAISLWLPVPPKKVFDFLRNGESRNQWDILSHGRLVEEIAHVINGENPENRVSVLKVDSEPNKIEIFYVQESYTDPTGSYVIYVPMDIYAMNKVFRGINPDHVAILPSGFAVFPGRAPTAANGDEEVGGSLLTIAYHITDPASSEECIPSESIETINRVINYTADSIKASLL